MSFFHPSNTQVYHQILILLSSQPFPVLIHRYYLVLHLRHFKSYFPPPHLTTPYYNNDFFSSPFMLLSLWSPTLFFFHLYKCFWWCVLHVFLLRLLSIIISCEKIHQKNKQAKRRKQWRATDQLTLSTTTSRPSPPPFPICG